MGLALNILQKKITKVIFLVLLVLLLLVLLFYWRVEYNSPNLPKSSISQNDLIEVSKTHYVLNNSWLRQNQHGNWECYVEGSAYDRGRTLGILQEKLIEEQEVVFINEIEKHVPSSIMRRFLLAGIAWFNRDLDKQIPIEIRDEIYGVSEFFSDKYDWVGPKFNRILNYHASHDIGHAVQNMHLVACTAFGVWNNEVGSEDMIFGRNFDFYFGDDFAKNKIVLFCKPDNGLSYMSVTWAGFCGVVSGMNEAGLSITLNSDKSEIPMKSGTPVSIIAREILQYASTIDEAIAIADKYTSFVSESFAICSARDGQMVVIEKTPEKTGVYRPNENKIIVSNHFQSEALKSDPLNQEHILNSESMDRFLRVDELLTDSLSFEIDEVLSILRDQKGCENEDIGIGNPAAINQLLAHHAVIFKPYTRTAWVSNYPFQEGVFDAYDLNQFDQFIAPNVVFPISIDSLELKSDTFMQSENYSDFNKYKKLRALIIDEGKNGNKIEESYLSDLTTYNPNYYEAYLILGEYYYQVGDNKMALQSLQLGLSKMIPYQEDSLMMEKMISEIKDEN